MKHMTALVKKRTTPSRQTDALEDNHNIFMRPTVPRRDFCLPVHLHHIWFNKSTDKFLDNHTISTFSLFKYS